LSSLIFAHYPHQLIAVTRELLALPYEQQPWFRGIITFDEERAIAAEAPNNTIFFTYSNLNEVHLMFTETLASEAQKKKGYYAFDSIELHGEDISTHFPRDKFVLGLHNGGEIFGLAEHLVWQAVYEGDLGKVKQIVGEYKLDLKNSKYLNLLDNLIELYIAKTYKQVINNDIILWLLENGAELSSRFFPCAVMEKCDERVIKKLAQTAEIYQLAIKTLLERGSTYDTLKICWENYLQRAVSILPLLHFLMQNLDGKKFKAVTFKNRALIMTAWKFDKNFLFRQVPKEIMMEILSHDGIDEPPYWDFLDYVIKTFPLNNGRLYFKNFATSGVLKFFPLVWKNWDQKYYPDLIPDLLEASYDTDYENTPEDIAENLLDWTLKFLQRLPVPPMEVFFTSKLTKHCLFKPNATTLSILKVLLEKKIVQRSYLHHVVKYAGVWIPVIYYAVLGENKPAIKLLIDCDIWTDNVQAHGGLRFTQLIEQYPEKRHVQVFVEEYIAGSKQTPK
jgi:hypothetical protein